MKKSLLILLSFFTLQIIGSEADKEKYKKVYAQECIKDDEKDNKTTDKSSNINDSKEIEPPFEIIYTDESDDDEESE